MAAMAACLASGKPGSPAWDHSNGTRQTRARTACQVAVVQEQYSLGQPEPFQSSSTHRRRADSFRCSPAGLSSASRHEEEAQT